MRFFKILFVSTFFAALLFAAPAMAESGREAVAASAYQRARLQYYSLKRSDPKVDDLERWEQAGAELVSYIENYPNSQNQPQVLFLLAQLNDNMYRQRQFQAGASRAKYFYERIVEQHPKHFLCDDSLLYLSDLVRDVDHDYTKSEELYKRIISNYGLGDMRQVAEVRLQQLATLKASGSDKNPRGAAPAETEDTLISRLLRPKSEEIYVAKKPKATPLIIIDPGHGGDDLGALGVDGILEKDVALKISKYLSELIRERLRAETLLTRDDDRAVALEDRTKFANEKGADLFVSIHANASELRNAKGIETYYLDNTNDKASLKLAERENKSLETAQDDLSFIISDFIQNVKLDDSISLAHHLQDSLHGTVSRYYENVKNLGVKKAPFYVLVGAHMPCALVEVSFIDNPLDGRRLKEERYQKLIAQGLYEGVQGYFAAR